MNDAQLQNVMVQLLLHAMLGLAKYLLGHGEETEGHVEEALRLSPLDSFAYLWMLFAGVAKIRRIGEGCRGRRQ
jgi:hypothetical protein